MINMSPPNGKNHFNKKKKESRSLSGLASLPISANRCLCETKELSPGLFAGQPRPFLCSSWVSCVSQLFPPSTRLCCFRRHCSVCALSNSKLKSELRFQKIYSLRLQQSDAEAMNTRELSAKWRGMHHAGVGSTGGLQKRSCVVKASKDCELSKPCSAVKGSSAYAVLHVWYHWQGPMTGKMVQRQSFTCRPFPIASDLVWSIRDNYTCFSSRMGSLLGSVRATTWLQDSC